MTSIEQIARSLRNHVVRLAGDIGERNVYRPAASVTRPCSATSTPTAEILSPLYPTSNPAGNCEMRRLAAAFHAHSNFPIQHAATFAWVPGVAWSDHLSFWRCGYPAVMVTDTAWATLAEEKL